MTTNVNHQDSNITGLSYAVEETPGVLPTVPVWHPLEPNDYSDFGGDYKLLARRPINASRQRKKGVIVDLDAKGGFSQDVTADNFQDLLQTVMFAALRTKDENDTAATDGTSNYYTVASNVGFDYEHNDLIFAKAFDDGANNGLKKVTTPTSTHVLVSDTGITDSTGQAGIISRVGYEFDAGKASMVVSGTWDRLTVANVVAAQTFTVGGGGSVIQNGDTLTITNGASVTVYTFQTSLTAGIAGNVHVLIGANDTAALLNARHAINNSGGTAGVDYSTVGTGANPDVTAISSNATTLVVNALVTGYYGNRIGTTDSSAGNWGAATLSGGLGRDCTTFGLLPGQWVFIGGDQAAEQFFTGDNGFARVRATSANYIEFDKTEDTFVADDGTANNSGGTPQTIRIFFGRVLRNENDTSLIVARTVQFERTLGAPDTGSPSQIQAEYLPGSLVNEFDFDMKTADKVTAKVAILSTTHEPRTAAEGLKTGTRPDIVDSDCYNSTSDVSRIKMALVDDSGDAAPDPLFAYVTDLSFNIKNNIKQNKAVSVLGSFSTTAGIFEVMANMTAYFTDVQGIQAVRDNDNVTIDAHLVKANKGLTIDLPLVALGKAMADVKIDEAIMLPLTADAAKATSVNTNYDYTLLLQFWDYLPNLAD